MIKFGSVFVFVTLFCVGSVIGQTHTLTLEVEEVISDKGELKVALYDSKESFMEVPMAVRTEVVDMEKEDRTRIEFRDLPTGTYAVAVMQDLDRNGQLDMGRHGPTEPYGFSNNARGLSGPPSFEECTFALKKDKRLSITISAH